MWRVTIRGQPTAQPAASASAVAATATATAARRVCASNAPSSCASLPRGWLDWRAAPRAALSTSTSSISPRRRLASEAVAARIAAEGVRKRAQRTLDHMDEAHRQRKFEDVIRRYERHRQFEQSQQSEDSPLPRFQHLPTFNLVTDFKPFRLYLSALVAVQPAQAQSAFDSWCDVHGFTSHFSNLYDMMLAEYVRAGDLHAADALLARLKQARVKPDLHPQTCAKLLRAYLQSDDGTRASTAYQFVGLDPSAPFSLLTELFGMFAHWDHVGVCWDLHSDMERSEWDTPQWMTGQMRDMLLDLRRHLLGQGHWPHRWTQQLIATDPRMGKITFVQEALTKLGVDGDTDPTSNATTASSDSTAAPAPSASPTASSLAFNSTHAVSRLQQLLLSGSATILHFERAIKHVDPQSTVAIWQLLESAQPASMPSISDADDCRMQRPSVTERERIADQLAASGPLAPTQSLYNLVIQSLCAGGKSAERAHGALAFRLFRRMVQVGFHRTLLTYKRLAVALSGCGAPATSGLTAMWEQYQRDLEEMRSGAPATAATTAAGANRHPERDVFHLQIEVCEAMLFALSSSSQDKTAASQVERVVQSMERHGLQQNAATLSSQMLIAIYQHQETAAHRVWTQMQEKGFFPSESVVIKLLHMYARIRPASWKQRLSSWDLQRVLENVPRIQAVCAAADARGALSPAMCETAIVALARARAVGHHGVDAETETDEGAPEQQSAPDSAQPSYPSAPSPVVALQLQMDLIRSFITSVRRDFVLSKHVHLYVLCALQEVLAAQGAQRRREEAVAAQAQAQTQARGSNRPRQSQKPIPPALPVQLDIDVSAVTGELLTAMERAGYCPPPQLLLYAIRQCVRASSLDGPAPISTAPALALLNRFLSLSREESFVQQAFLATRQEMDAMNQGDTSSAQFAEALARFEPAALRNLVYSSLLRANIASTACTLAEVQRDPNASRASRVRTLTVAHRAHLSPVERDLVLDTLPAADTALSLLRTGTETSTSATTADGGTRAYCSFVDASDKDATNVPAASSATRLLVLAALNDTMLSVLARYSAAATSSAPKQLSPQFVASISTLLEALWESAFLYDVHVQLFTGPLRLKLTSALLGMCHPHASSIALRFCRTIDVNDLHASNRLVRLATMDTTVDALIESMQALLRLRRPPAELDELLLRAEQLPQKLVDRITRIPRFYQSLFVAFAMRGHDVKILAYFHMLMAEHNQCALDSETACVLVESLDRCNQPAGLAEVVASLESLAVSSSAHASSFGPPLLAALARAYIRQDAFADADTGVNGDANANAGFRPSCSGDGTLSRAVSLVDSPLAQSTPPLSFLLRLLKCCLMVDDQQSVERVLLFLHQHHADAAAAQTGAPVVAAAASAASASSSAVDQSMLSGEIPIDNEWPSGALWREAGAAYPHFLFHATMATTTTADAAGEPETSALEQLRAQCDSIHVLAARANLPALMAALRQLARDIDAAESAHAASTDANVFSASRNPSVLWTLRQLQDDTLGTAARLLAQHELAARAERGAA